MDELDDFTEFPRVEWQDYVDPEDESLVAPPDPHEYDLDALLETGLTLSDGPYYGITVYPSHKEEFAVRIETHCHGCRTYLTQDQAELLVDFLTDLLESE